MIMQIPKKLLIHSAELITKFDPDKWGNSSSEEIIPLKFVRIETCVKMTADSNGNMIRLSAVLFFDCKSSVPKEIKFALKSDILNGKTVDIQQVKFGEKIFTVQTIEPFYADENKIHHYEVGLM